MNKTIIECSCKVCEVNAKYLGKELPLKASVTEALAKVLGKNTHATVELAHHPILGKSAAKQSNIVAVA